MWLWLIWLRLFGGLDRSGFILLVMIVEVMLCFDLFLIIWIVLIGLCLWIVF